MSLLTWWNDSHVPSVGAESSVVLPVLGCPTSPDQSFRAREEDRCPPRSLLALTAAPQFPLVIRDRDPSHAREPLHCGVGTREPKRSRVNFEFMSTTTVRPGARTATAPARTFGSTEPAVLRTESRKVFSEPHILALGKMTHLLTSGLKHMPFFFLGLFIY